MKTATNGFQIFFSGANEARYNIDVLLSVERNRSVAQLYDASRTYLLLLDDVDASLDVGEGVHGGEDGLPLVLLAQLAARPPALCEGRGVHETPQVEVLLKVGQAVLHLVVVKVGLHKGDLDVRLTRRIKNNVKPSKKNVCFFSCLHKHANTTEYNVVAVWCDAASLLPEGREKRR